MGPHSTLFSSAGSASTRPSSPHRSAERGPGAETLHREQCGRKDPGSCQVQAECGSEGDPGGHVRSEVFKPRAEGIPAGHIGT